MTRATRPVSGPSVHLILLLSPQPALTVPRNTVKQHNGGQQRFRGGTTGAHPESESGDGEEADFDGEAHFARHDDRLLGLAGWVVADPEGAPDCARHHDTGDGQKPPRRPPSPSHQPRNPKPTNPKISRAKRTARNTSGVDGGGSSNASVMSGAGIEPAQNQAGVLATQTRTSAWKSR